MFVRLSWLQCSVKVNCYLNVFRSRCCWRLKGSFSPPVGRSTLRHPGVPQASLWAQVRTGGGGHVFHQVNRLFTDRTGVNRCMFLWFSGASLYWGDPVQPLLHQEVQAPPPSFSPTPPPCSSPGPPSSPAPPSSSPSPSSCRPPPHTDLSVIRPGGGAEDSDLTGQESAVSPSGHHR